MTREEAKAAIVAGEYEDVLDAVERGNKDAARADHNDLLEMAANARDELNRLTSVVGDDDDALICAALNPLIAAIVATEKRQATCDHLVCACGDGVLTAAGYKSTLEAWGRDGVLEQCREGVVVFGWCPACGASLEAKP